MNFDPDTFLKTIESMLATSDCSNSDTEGSLSLSEGEEDGGVAEDERETGDAGLAEGDVEEVLARMEEELAVTEVGKSFEKMVSVKQDGLLCSNYISTQVLRTLVSGSSI